MTRACWYKPEIKNASGFMFGPKLDSDGHTYVGSGEDDDPFIIGVTSLALVDTCLQSSRSGKFVQFHADATLKVSDLGYPVITCGITDKDRSYYVGAIFVVSQQTENEYT
ncbi:hypothetical protein JG688_00006240 [Phytophthora aleatoria]|uniref:Uncharacterized protein n=1 Tax=Phytophthora aleatoria TaxID=2496075 RepID=A0A8J5ITY8_9STRA|nr:hypothetical protein JG688_00006240 [Phytophthora aleatoria]